MANIKLNAVNKLNTVKFEATGEPNIKRVVCYHEGFQIKRYDWFNAKPYYISLSTNIDNIDFSKVNKGLCNVTLGHTAPDNVEAIIGVSVQDSFQIMDGKVMWDIRLASEPKNVIDNINDGIVTNVSMTVELLETTTKEMDGIEYIYADKWSIGALAVVVEPAVDDARIIPATSVEAPVATPVATPVEAAKLASETKRIQRIIDLAHTHDASYSVVSAAIVANLSPEKAESIFRSTKKDINLSTVKGKVDVMGSPIQNFASTLQNVLSHKATRNTPNPVAILPQNREYANWTLFDLCKEFATLSGHETRGRTHLEILDLAFRQRHNFSGMVPGDLPGIFQNVTRDSFLIGTHLNPTINRWQEAVKRMDTPNMETVTGYDVTGDVKPKKRLGNAPLNIATLSANPENLRPDDYQLMVEISFPALLNDQKGLNLIGELPVRMGYGAAESWCEAFFNIFVNNPTLSDGNDTFVAANTTAATDIADGIPLTLDTMQAKLDTFGRDTLAFIVVPPEEVTMWRQFLEFEQRQVTDPVNAVVADWRNLKVLTDRTLAGHGFRYGITHPMITSAITWAQYPKCGEAVFTNEIQFGSNALRININTYFDIAPTLRRGLICNEIA